MRGLVGADSERGGRGRRKRTYDAGEQPVVGEELEPGGLDVRFEAVQLDAVAVVDEDILLLSHSVMGMVM